MPDLVCEQCLAGRYNLCPGMRLFATPPVDGAFAEHVVVHAAFAHPVPDSMSDDAGGPARAAVGRRLGLPQGQGHGRLARADHRRGPIGLIAVQTAVAFGATEVVVSDVNPARLALARELGATEVVDVRERSVRELARPPQVLIECSGFPPAIGDGIRALDRAGRAVLVGMGSDEVPLPLAAVQTRELEVTGTFRYAGTWPTAIALAAAGRVGLDRLVTGTYRLAQVADALTAGRRDPTTVKVVVRPGE